LAHWQAFHRRIFGKLYPWAGELRAVQIAKSNAFYARPEHIASYAQGVFGELARESYLKDLDRSAFAERRAAGVFAICPANQSSSIARVKRK